MLIQCVTHFSMNGDNSVLEEKLEYFRRLVNIRSLTKADPNEGAIIAIGHGTGLEI
jgi:hypothetical protein